MAREGLRSHLSGSVPVSIVLHLVVLLVLVVIPLADLVVPMPAMTMPSYDVLAAPLPPPPAVLRRLATPSPSPSPSGPVAPTKAPETITPETDAAPPSIVTSTIGDDALASVGVVGSVGPPAPLPPAVPEPPPHVPDPIRVAQLPEPPRKTVDVRPIYPEVARAARKEGTVILEAMLDTTGRVTQLRVIRSEPLLDQAALDAVRQWRYTPSMYGGRPVSVLMTITVRFTLGQ